MPGDYWIGWDSEHLCFFRPFGFRRECYEALLFVAIIGHIFTFHGKVKDGECHRSRDLRTSNDGSSICCDR
jgi:hypothetical protein